MLKKINSTKTMVYVCPICRNAGKDNLRTIKISEIFIYLRADQIFMMLPKCEECGGITFLPPNDKNEERRVMKQKLMGYLIKNEQFLDSRGADDAELHAKVKKDLILAVEEIQKRCKSNKDNVTK